jgi:quercetin dioxygenase-like cupin family protein
MKRAWPVIAALAVVVAFVSIVVAVNEADEDEGRVENLIDSGAATAPVNGVTRTVLGQFDPTNAPGQTLYLQRVVIEPKAQLAEHFHDGTQVARIVSGTLTFNVATGTTTITRADGTVEEVTGPKQVELEPGDWIVETAQLEHYGANETDEQVVIELAALLATGSPVATAVGTGSSGTPLRLTTNLTSPDRRLFNAGANGSTVYGWNHLTGTSNVDGRTVGVDLLGAVTYRSGSGPFSGFITFTFPDGSTLGVSMQGMTVASADTKNASFIATLGVIDGTGRYEGAAGTGTFTGSRTAALGAAVAATFDLRLTSGG